jgi:hypothetical protein
MMIHSVRRERSLPSAGVEGRGRNPVRRVSLAVPAWMVLGLLLVAGSRVAAQTPVDTSRASVPTDATSRSNVDTTGRTAADATRSMTIDTTRSMAADTVRGTAPDSAAAAARAAATGVIPPTPRTGPAPGGPPSVGAVPSGAAPYSGGPPSPTTLAPTDTTLARVCRGVPGGIEAPGLLAVVFRAGTSDQDRIAAAKSVGGTLGGPSEYGEEYVLLPPDAGALTVVADKLIRQDPVTQVSPAPCPPTVEAGTPAPAAAGGATPPAPTPAAPDTSPAPAQRAPAPDSSGAPVPAPATGTPPESKPTYDSPCVRRRGHDSGHGPFASPRVLSCAPTRTHATNRTSIRG